jgi:hypothetical protein
VSLEHESVKRLYLEVEGEPPEAAADRIRAAIAR